MTTRLDSAQLDDLKSRHRLSDVLRQCGVPLTGKGRVSWAKSPFNAEKTPSFKCDDARGLFYDWSSGQHGDHFDAIMSLTGRTFPEAVEMLGGTRDLTDEDRRAIQARQEALRHDEIKTEHKDQASARRQFAAAAGIRGTHAEAYLAARGLLLPAGFGDDLRFASTLTYRGYVDEAADETQPLGQFPAMLAAIRNADGIIIGLHRTYLDPVEPKKLTPPGDQRRNRAKKILGSSAGMIRLSPLTDHMVMGEGIESTLSGRALGIGHDGSCYAAGVSLGNMAGAATGTVPHPEHPDQPRRRVPNGVPDHQRPGIVLPDHIHSITLLVDGDSERCMTWARICVAGRRFAELERQVAVHVAPTRMDHNDMLMRRVEL